MPSNGAEMQALRASQVWDVMARGGAVESGGAEADMRATIARLHELGAAPRPEAAFAQRLEAELLRAQTSALFGALPATRNLTKATNGATPPPPSAGTVPQRVVLPIKQWLAPLATAALIVLALAGTLILTKGPWRIARGDVLPVILPAIQETLIPSAPPGITADTLLFQQRFDEIPDGAYWAGVERTILGPDAVMHQGTPETSGVGPMLYRVEGGTITGRADGPFFVTRSGRNTPTPIQADTDVLLSPGDVAFVPAGVATDWRNTGSSSATILDSGVAVPGGVDGGKWVDGALISFAAPIDALLNAPPTGPADLTVRRLTLEPGAILPGAPSTGLKLVGVEVGTLTVTWETASGSSASRDTIELTAGRWVNTESSGKTARELSNEGIEPLTLLIMTLIPADAGSTSLTSGTPAPTSTNASADPTLLEKNTAQAELAGDGAVASGLADDVLMHGTFDAFPKLATWQGIARATLAPGTAMALGASENDGEGPMLYRVEFGELTVNADGPISITRNGATTAETIPAGTDVVLQEGDQGFTPSGVTSRWRNDRKVPAVILDAGITTSGYGALPDGVTHDAIVASYASAPQSPVAVTVRRLTLPPQQAFGARDLPGLQLLYVESGAVDVASADQLGLSNTIFATGPENKPGQAVSAGSAYPGAFPADGVVRVSGTEPATVLVMTVTHAGASAGAPMS